MDDATEEIIGAAIEAHRILGPGLLESIDEEALCHELGLRNIEYQRQVPLTVHYKGKALSGQRLDLIVMDEVVVEIKSTRSVPDSAMAQVL